MAQLSGEKFVISEIQGFRWAGGAVGGGWAGGSRKIQQQLCLRLLLLSGTSFYLSFGKNTFFSF